MAIAFTVYVTDETGYDASLFFPGLHDINYTSKNDSEIAFDIPSIDRTTYRNSFSGNDIGATTLPGSYDLQGNITSVAFKYVDESNTLFSVGNMSISFTGADSESRGVSMTSAYGMTPDTLMNAVSSSTRTFTVIGNAGADKLISSSYADILDGKGGADTMIGRGGNDKYFVDNAKDVVVEAVGEGSDYVLASVSYGLKTGSSVEKLSTTSTAGSAAINLTGNEVGQSIYGNEAGNKINALAGNDTLYGYGGNDGLLGGDGNDVLYGGAGRDALTGGLGNDVFVFDTALSASTNIDTVVDFHNASGDNDTIRLSKTVFTDLATGALNANLFKANATGTATDADDRIIYNTSTGALFYDSNGNGSGASIQFATLTGHPALTAADFVVA